MNFIRGIEPLRSMKIGIVTWNNLGPGCFLENRKGVPLVAREDGSLRFVSDGAKAMFHINYKDLHIVILGIERKKSTIRIQYRHIDRDFILEGSIERFRKYFNIIQGR